MNCCCTWVRDAINQTPYICVGGSDAKVKIYGIDGRLIEVPSALRRARHGDK